MNRRVWIKQVIVAGGGTLLLPACMGDEGAVSIPLKNISITAKEEHLLAELTEAIIPQTDTPGAKTLNLHQFVLKIIDDCYDKPSQESMLAGLKQLNPFAEKIAGNVFSELSKNQKIDVLRKVSVDENAGIDLKFFIHETRKWAIKGYTSSKFVLTKIFPYELIPTRFHGCVPVSKSI